MKIALIQTNPQSDFKTNLQNAIALLKKAAHQGAELILFPEVFLFRGEDEERKRIAPEILETLATFQSLAHKLHVYLIAGTLDETSDDKHADQQKNDEFKFYNTCVTFSPDGEIISKYRKVHLFNLRDEQGKPVYCESNVYKTGSMPNIYQITAQNEVWDTLNIICYDVRFPEIIRHLNKPPDVVFVPAAFTWQTGNDHWEILLRARAIENQCFVAACNQTGFSHHGQKRNYGNSMVVDPWGKIIARLGDDTDILFCEISKSVLLQSRAKLPALNDRKIF